MPSALRSSSATVKAIQVWNSWLRRHPPQMREKLLPVRIIRRQKATTSEDTYLYKPPGLLYCRGCTWTRIISRQTIQAITWHFSQQTLLERLTVSGARASSFGERYREVLYQNLHENNNTQTKYRLLYSSTPYVNNSVTVRVCVCVCYMQFAGYTNIVCVRLVADDETTSAEPPTRRGAYETTYVMRNRR